MGNSIHVLIAINVMCCCEFFFFLFAVNKTCMLYGRVHYIKIKIKIGPFHLERRESKPKA
jgi:hypothetical protein